MVKQSIYRKDHMAERKYCKMKKDIHPEYRTVIHGDNYWLYQFLWFNKTLSNESWVRRRDLPIDPRVDFIRDSHILHWTSKVHSSAETRGSFQQKIRSQIMIREQFRLYSFLFLEILRSFHARLFWVVGFTKLLQEGNSCLSTRP